ncbi:acyltransferase family protein [Roseomonas haemaphysalidis]|uniref:Acyltransferase n=1 Tax=Roseomonas haemaphysalidis TaxID=2768162 RepID=A0ABS3KTM4_9PROT|nr:acyltransferase [Roseomonas haemaphysalidis]MBO1080779.1 acyltransferase [Roseomonas haemaphysalidis]
MPDLTPSSKPHFAYIDCLRGYAVLLVIGCHLVYSFPELPNPVRRLMVTGWFGVQLFFLASSLTLLMSWHSELRRNGRVSLRAFALRRFWRIAPAYYAAGLLYYLVQPPALGFDGLQVLRTAIFVNAWHPAWLTVPEAWYVVPGGWSISVEFAFYAVFPLFAALVTSLGRAWLALLACLGIGVVANLMAEQAFAGSYAPAAIENFLFFWFPNQLSIFALGGVLFFTLRNQPRLMGWVERHSTALALGAIVAFCLIAYLPWLGKYLGAMPWLPAGHVASLPLAVFALALSRHRGLLVNRAAAAMGAVSFSAYLLHFAVLHVVGLLPGLFMTRSAGVAAIAAYGLSFVACVALTFLLSKLSYHLIEQPGVALGKRLIARLRPSRVVATPVG